MKFKTYVIFYVYLYSFPAFYLISMYSIDKILDKKYYRNNTTVNMIL